MDAQQCDESALPYDVATYAFTIPARDGHAIDARVYAPAPKEIVLRQKPGPSDAHDAFAGVVYAHGAASAKATASPSRIWAAASRGGA